MPGVIEHRRVGGVVSNKYRKDLIDDFLLNHAPLVRLMLAGGYLQPSRIIVILIHVLGYFIILWRSVSESKGFAPKGVTSAKFFKRSNFYTFHGLTKITWMLKLIFTRLSTTYYLHLLNHAIYISKKKNYGIIEISAHIDNVSRTTII